MAGELRDAVALLKPLFWRVSPQAVRAVFAYHLDSLPKVEVKHRRLKVTLLIHTKDQRLRLDFGNAVPGKAECEAIVAALTPEPSG